MDKKTKDTITNELLENALREHPKYTVVGEVRGEEMVEALKTMKSKEFIQTRTTIMCESPIEVIEKFAKYYND